MERISLDLQERFGKKANWYLWKYRNMDDWLKSKEADNYLLRCFDYKHIPGNIMLQIGVEELWKLALETSVNGFQNGTSELVIGNGAAAEVNTQTGPQGGTFVALAMDAGFPILEGAGNTTLAFQIVATAAQANQSWDEFLVKQNVSLIHFNRRVASQGTKISPQVWTLKLTILGS